MVFEVSIVIGAVKEYYPEARFQIIRQKMNVDNNSTRTVNDASGFYTPVAPSLPCTLLPGNNIGMDQANAYTDFHGYILHLGCR